MKSKPITTLSEATPSEEREDKLKEEFYSFELESEIYNKDWVKKREDKWIRVPMSDKVWDWINEHYISREEHDKTEEIMKENGFTVINGHLATYIGKGVNKTEDLIWVMLKREELDSLNQTKTK